MYISVYHESQRERQLLRHSHTKQHSHTNCVCSHELCVLTQIVCAHTICVCSHELCVLIQFVCAHTNCVCSYKLCVLIRIVCAHTNRVCSHELCVLIQFVCAHTICVCSHECVWEWRLHSEIPTQVVWEGPSHSHTNDCYVFRFSHECVW